MPTRHEIKCINKVERYNPHERITHIGGLNADGTNWKLSQTEAIAGVQTGKWAFFVKKGGHLVDVVVATSRFNNPYLKTVADGDQPDNLLSLLECR